MDFYHIKIKVCVYINILSKITTADGEFILKYLGLFLAIIKLIFFKIKFNKSFNLISFLYLLNFFYLFDINHLKHPTPEKFQTIMNQNGLAFQLQNAQPVK